MKILNIKDISELNTREPVLFGSDRYVTALEYVKQKLIQRLSVIQGELKSSIPSFSESRMYGVPYLDKFNRDETDLLLKSTIMSIPEILAITSWVSNQEGSVYTCEFTCMTVEGVLSWRI